jgi:hypothetical protein
VLTQQGNLTGRHAVFVHFLKILRNLRVVGMRPVTMRNFKPIYFLELTFFKTPQGGTAAQNKMSVM